MTPRWYGDARRFVDLSQATRTMRLTCDIRVSKPNLTKPRDHSPTKPRPNHLDGLRAAFPEYACNRKQSATHSASGILFLSDPRNGTKESIHRLRFYREYRAVEGCGVPTARVVYATGPSRMFFYVGRRPVPSRKPAIPQDHGPFSR